MNLVTEAVKPGLIKYLHILDSDSKIFRKRAEEMRRQYPQKPGDPGLKPEVMDHFLDEFFIPKIPDNKTYVSYYLLTGLVQTKYKFSFHHQASPEIPGEIEIKCPSIAVVISEKMTERDWIQVGKDLKKAEKHIKGRVKSYRSFKKSGAEAKSWKNIDLLLDIYRMSQDGKTIKMITSALRFKKSYEEETVRKMLKKIRVLVDSLR